MAFKLEEDKLRLLKNFISLLILQGTNYLIPLIIFPYLVRVLGAEKFGLIMFAQAFIQYFVILTNYGFNLSATREVSINRNSKSKLSEIFSSVLIIKFFLILISLVLLTFIVFSFERFQKDWIIYYLTFGIVIGQALFPLWLFQGLERMEFITFFNFLIKVITTISIFFIVKSKEDFLYVPFIYSIGYILIALLSLYITFKYLKVSFTTPNLSKILYYFKESGYVFISTVSYNLYTNSTKFFIGIFLGDKLVGFYSIAELIVNSFRQLINIFFQIFYPLLSKKIKQGFHLYAIWWRKLFKISLIVNLLLLIFIFFLPKKLFLLIFPKDLLYSYTLMKVLALSIPLQSLMNLFGMQSILILGYTKFYSLSYITVSAIYILISPLVLMWTKNIWSIMILMLLTEVVIVIIRIVFLYNIGELYAIFGYSKNSKKEHIQVKQRKAV